MEMILTAGAATLVALMEAERNGRLDARTAECDRQGSDEPTGERARRRPAAERRNDDGRA